MNAMMRRLWMALAIALVAPSPAATTATTLSFSDTKSGVDLPSGWKIYAMSRHRTAASMAIVRDGDDDVFSIDANHASGAIAHELDIPAANILSWRWKVNHSVAEADLSKKSGDDFAARIYVFFDVPRTSLSWLQRMRLNLAGYAVGHALPTSALCYVWDNHHPVGTILPSAYSDLVRTIVVHSGDVDAGTWQLQQRNLAADFRAAFGRAAPRVTGIALASDTDNTGGHVKAWFGNLTLTPSTAAPASPEAK